MFLPLFTNALAQASIGSDKAHKWACMSDGQAAVQLFHRLNHARQTVDFVRRQRAAFTRLNKARMTVFEVRRCKFWDRNNHLQILHLRLSTPPCNMH